jgi:hypothetical protein
MKSIFIEDPLFLEEDFKVFSLAFFRVSWFFGHNIFLSSSGKMIREGKGLPFRP